MWGPRGCYLHVSWRKLKILAGYFKVQNLKFKPKINNVHTVEVKATNMKTDYKVDNINFLYDNQNKFNFLVFDYLFSQEKRDYKVYPLNGSLNEFHIEYFQVINNNFKNLSLSLKIDNHNKENHTWKFSRSITVWRKPSSTISNL